VRCEVEPGTCIVLKKLFKNIPVNPLVEPEIMGPKELEELEILQIKLERI
jgi:hypothetical protein